jgi:hypothetical protein
VLWIVSLYGFGRAAGHRGDEALPAFFRGRFFDAQAISSVMLVFFAVQSIYWLGRPRLRATLSPGRLPIGGTARLAWTIRGPAGRVRSLRLELEGAQHAGYMRGSDLHFESSTFYIETLLETKSPSEIAAGSLQVTLPKYAMHSFKAKFGKIVWTVNVLGGNERRPEIRETCEIAVDPLPEA